MKLKFLLLCLLVYPYFLCAGDSLNDKTEFMTRRNAVIETFVNDGSYQGAITYGVLNDYIRKNPDGIIPIVYHTYSPFPYDPFYQINKVMNLNRWSLYAQHFDMSLDNSAAVGGHSFTQDRNDMDSLVRAVNYEHSIFVPAKMTISMTKTVDSAEITVRIQSVSNFGNRRVFIFLMDSYYTKYDLYKYWDGDSLNPNQENYFRWIPRAIVPNENGLEVYLKEGTDTTLKIKVPTKRTGLLNDQKLYATAVLQEPLSTDIIQAVTTYNPFRPKLKFEGKDFQTGDSAYIQVTRDQKNYFTFTLENPCDHEITYNVRAFPYSQLLYISLVRYDDTTYTLQPYEKRDIRLLVVSQDYAEFAKIDLVIKPINIPDQSYQQDAFFLNIFAVSKGLYCATLHTYPKLEKDADALDNIIRYYSEDWAVLPYDVFMKGFSDMPIKLYYLMLDTRNIPTFGVFKRRVDFFLSLLDRGKGVILSSPYELAMAQNEYKGINYITQPNFRTFLSDNLGITLGTHFNINHLQLSVYGIDDSEFGLDVTRNNTIINDPNVITLTSNIESMKINGKNLRTKGFLKYNIVDMPNDEFAGVTSEIGTGRLLYLGFGLENAAFDGRRNIVENTMFWLIKDAKPKRGMLVIKPSGLIDFGTKEIYSTTAVNVNISNGGDSTLIIKDVYIENYNESFIFDTLAIKYRLEPGESFDLPVVFEPKKRQDMETYLCVNSDAYFSPYASLTLIGTGVLTQSILPPNDDDDYWIDISGKNNSEKINIKFAPNRRAKKIKITLIDGDGNQFNIPYSPKNNSKIQSMTFNKKLINAEKYKLQIDMDGKILTKNINDYKVK
jgi:hypothetical protein